MCTAREVWVACTWANVAIFSKAIEAWSKCSGKAGTLTQQDIFPLFQSLDIYPSESQGKHIQMPDSPFPRFLFCYFSVLSLVPNRHLIPFVCALFVTYFTMEVDWKRNCLKYFLKSMKCGNARILITTFSLLEVSVSSHLRWNMHTTNGCPEYHHSRNLLGIHVNFTWKGGLNLWKVLMMYFWVGHATLQHGGRMWPFLNSKATASHTITRR